MTSTRDKRSKGRRTGPDEDGAFHISTKGGPTPHIKKRKLDNVHELSERHFNAVLLNLALSAHPDREQLTQTINTLSGWGYSPHELKLAAVHGTTSEELLSKLRHDRNTRSWAILWRYMPFATRKDVHPFFVVDAAHDDLTHLAARSNTDNGILFGYSKEMLDTYAPKRPYESRYHALRETERPVGAWPPPQLSEKERHKIENGTEFTSEEEEEEPAEPEPVKPATDAPAAVISMSDVASTAVADDLNIALELFSAEFAEPAPAPAPAEPIEPAPAEPIEPAPAPAPAEPIEPAPAPAPTEPIESRRHKEVSTMSFTRPTWPGTVAQYANEKRGILQKIATKGPSSGITLIAKSKLEEMMQDQGARPLLKHQTNAILLATRSMMDTNDNHVESRGCMVTLKPGAGKTAVAIDLAQVLNAIHAIDAAFVVVPPALVDTWTHEARACSSEKFRVQIIEIQRERVAHPFLYAIDLTLQAIAPRSNAEVRTTTLFILRNSLLNADPRSKDAINLSKLVRYICGDFRTMVVIDEVHLNHRDPMSNPSRNAVVTFTWCGTARHPPIIVGMSANPIMNTKQEYYAMLRTIGFQTPPGISLHKTTPEENAALLGSVTIDSAITGYSPYLQTPPHAVLLAKVHPITAEAEEKITESLQQVTGVVKGAIRLENMPKFLAAARIAAHVVRTQGRNACIFVDYVKGLEAIASWLEGNGVGVVRIHSGVSQEERTRGLDEANREGAEARVICATSGAGGTGLSMQNRCDLLIYATMPWSIKIGDQVGKRIARIRKLGDPTRITTMLVMQGDAEAEARMFASAMDRLDAFGAYYDEKDRGATGPEADLVACDVDTVVGLTTAIHEFHRHTGKAIRATRHTRLIEAMSQCPAGGTVTLEEAVATAGLEQRTADALRSFLAPV